MELCTEVTFWKQVWNNRCQFVSLQWRHNEHDGVSNHQRLHCLLNCWFRRRSKKTSKLRITGLCAGNSPVTGEFPAQRASNAKNVSIWWRHRDEQDYWLYFLITLIWDIRKLGFGSQYQTICQFFISIGLFSVFLDCMFSVKSWAFYVQCAISRCSENMAMQLNGESRYMYFSISLSCVPFVFFYSLSLVSSKSQSFPISIFPLFLGVNRIDWQIDWHRRALELVMHSVIDWLSLHGRHDERDSVSNHRRLDCLHNVYSGADQRKHQKLGVTGLCEGNPPSSSCCIDII